MTFNALTLCIKIHKYIKSSFIMLVCFYIKKQPFRSNRLFSILFLSLSAERSVYIDGPIRDLQVNAHCCDWPTVSLIKTDAAVTYSENYMGYLG